MSDILPVIRSVVRFIQVISSLPVQYLASYVTDRYLTDVDVYSITAYISTGLHFILNKVA